MRELPPSSGAGRGRFGFEDLLECFEQTLVRGVHVFQIGSASRAGLLAGFIIALLRAMHGASKIMWVSKRAVSVEGGDLYGPGLLESGLSPDRFLFVEASRSSDVLWTLEEGLRSRAVGAVVGEFGHDPYALDLTATRRLALRSGASRIPAYLAVIADEMGATASRTRWRISGAPSRPSRGALLLGDPVWAVDLIKNRSGPCGRATLGYSAARESFFPVNVGGLGVFDRIIFDRKHPIADPSATSVIPFTTSIRQDEGDGR